MGERMLTNLLFSVLIVDLNDMVNIILRYNVIIENNKTLQVFQIEIYDSYIMWVENVGETNQNADYNNLLFILSNFSPQNNYFTP